MKSVLQLLQKLQAWEQKQSLYGFRQFLEKLIGAGVYRFIDRWLLTIGSTFGLATIDLMVAKEILLRSQWQAEMINIMVIGFAVDLVLNTIARGSKYWYEVRPCPINSEKLQFAWKTDPLINGLSFVAMGGGLAGYLDQSRIVRIVRKIRILRLIRVSGVKNSLEDMSVSQIDEERSRMIFSFVVGVSLFTLLPEYGPLLGLSVIMWSISRNAKLTRGIINSVFTKRIRETDEAFIKLLNESSQLRFLTAAYKSSRDEIAKIEDRFSELLEMIREMINPFGEDLELNESHEVVPKDLEVTVLFSDIRNFTPLTEKYGKDVAPVLADYFSEMLLVIKKHGGRLGNTTGDGLACYFKEDENKTGEMKSIECATALGPVAKKYDLLLQEKFPLVGKENDHSTGLGIKTGEVTIGDFLSRKGESGEGRREIHRPDLIGATVNRAARIESISKNYRDCILLMSNSEYERLPKAWRLAQNFTSCDFHFLKGVGDVQIWGLRPPSEKFQ